ncbi:MAG: two-component system response regulator, partial [Shimia sp.]|nr:two-component system response regulator [Shimia sp.]
MRGRDGDIEVLAQYFFDRFMTEVPAFRGKSLSRDAVAMLREYRFPGNVRELKNIIERAVYRDSTNEICPEDIGLLDQAILPAAAVGTGGFQEQVEEFKRRLILDAFNKADRNQAQAARLLGLSYHQLRY